jgi:tripartite-type tricarboxylate transporter receptor subunit TctC
MTMMRITVLLAFLLASAIAHAQSYPARTVRIVVPSIPGGGLDLTARNVAPKLSEIWGQPVVIENRGGANFIVGTDAVAKAAPDGHTLLVVSSSALSINPVAFPNLPYDPRDLAPITLLGSGTFVLLVGSQVPANNLQELVALLRANPGKFNHASNSASTMLASELLKAMTKAEYQDINYKGSVAAVNATAAGETQLCFVDIATAGAAVRAGRVRILGVTSPTRKKLQPELPTLAESGVPGYSVVSWTILIAPSKTPPAVLSRISADTLRALAAPEVVQRFESQGNEVLAATMEETQRTLREDAEKWARLVKERRIKLEGV